MDIVSQLPNGCLIAVREDGGVYNGVARGQGRELARGSDADLDALTDYLETCALEHT